MTEKWTPPDWVYTDNRPKTDTQYFENLTRCIFQAGLSWQLMANKWPNFQKAFHSFNITKIAGYGAKDITRLSNDAGIVRNKRKINATIHNAREFERIIKESSSYQNWLDSLDKTNNYDNVVKQLKSHFKHVGPSTAHIFLWSVGEPLKYDQSIHQRQPRKIV